jgi:hypothetical protein
LARGLKRQNAGKLVVWRGCGAKKLTPKTKQDCHACPRQEAFLLMTNLFFAAILARMKVNKKIFAAALAVLVVLSACGRAGSKEIESNFIALLSAVHENDRETILRYAPFIGEITPDEEKTMIDFFTQIALSEKTIEAVPGGTRIKNLTVTLHPSGASIIFSFEKQKGVWALTKNVRVVQAPPDAQKQ